MEPQGSCRKDEQMKNKSQEKTCVLLREPQVIHVFVFEDNNGAHSFKP